MRDRTEKQEMDRRERSGNEDTKAMLLGTHRDSKERILKKERVEGD